MGYIGNEPTTGHFPVDNFTSSGGSTYTLAKAPATAGAIEVSVQGVLQPTTAYTVSGTTLTMAGVTTGVKIFVRHLGETLSLPTPADGSVTTTKLGTNSVDGTKIAMGSDARGDILYHGATDYARLAKGTSGQVLTMGANDPAWADAGGGGLIYIATATASTSSSLTFTSIPSSGYTNFVFVVQGLYPSTGGRLQMRTSTNNGSSYDSGGSDYAYTSVVYDSTSAWGTYNSTGSDLIKISGGNVKSTVADGGYHGVINMSNPTDTVRKKIIHWTGGFVQNTITTSWGTGHRLATTDIDAVEFTTSSSGTFTAGSITLYGMKSS